MGSQWVYIWPTPRRLPQLSKGADFLSVLNLCDYLPNILYEVNGQVAGHSIYNIFLEQIPHLVKLTPERSKDSGMRLHNNSEIVSLVPLYVQAAHLAFLIPSIVKNKRHSTISECGCLDIPREYQGSRGIITLSPMYCKPYYKWL